MSGVRQDILVNIVDKTGGLTQASFSDTLIFGSNVTKYGVDILTLNSGLTWTAVANGTVHIGIVYIVSGNSTPLTVARTGSGTIGTPYLITVNVATDSGGLPISTALQIKTASDLVVNVSAIVSIALTGTGTGLVSAVALTPMILSIAKSKAKVFRTFTSITSLLEVYSVTDEEYKSAVSLLSGQRKPSKFYVYSKENSETTTQGLADALAQNSDWYYLCLVSKVKAEIELASTFISALEKMLIVGGADLTLYDVLETRRTAVLSYNVGEHKEIEWLGSNSTFEPGLLTWKWKRISGEPSTFTDSQKETIRSKSGNTIVRDNGVVYVNGSFTTQSGQLIQDVVFIDYVGTRLREDIFLLFLNNPKIGFDVNEFAQITSVINARLKSFGVAGSIAAVDPAVDSDLAFSQDGSYLYRVTIPNRSDVPAVERANGLLRNVNAEFYLSGSIEKIELNLIINK